MQCHNFCEPKSAMPSGARTLLGMGLKYCIKKPRPTNKTDKTIERLSGDVRRNWFFKYNAPPKQEGAETTYIPGLYIKSGWDPPKCKNSQIEENLINFGNSLRKARYHYRKPTISNLTPRQWKMARSLKEDDTFMFVEGDKNVGGCILHPGHN